MVETIPDEAGGCWEKPRDGPWELVRWVRR